MEKTNEFLRYFEEGGKARNKDEENFLEEMNKQNEKLNY